MSWVNIANGEAGSSVRAKLNALGASNDTKGQGTVVSVASLTLGTTGTDLTSSVATSTTTPVITLNVPSASASNRGVLLASDWSTFNGKQATITFGSNVQTALGVNIGSAGAPVLFNGAAGTPSSIVLTNATGSPVLTALTVTTVNKLTITAPATNATLTIADGKTLTASNSITFAGTDATTMTFPAASASVGYLGIPQNIQSANYTTVLADAGKEIYHPVGDNNARTFTIDSNANVAYPIGTAITFTNMAAAALTIAITSDTMYLSGAGTTGNRALAQYGTATAVKKTATTWLISGGANLT